MWRIKIGFNMLWKHLCICSSNHFTVSAVQLFNMLDYLVTGSSMYCATDRLQVTNDYKKTNRVGQIVSNVSESIQSPNDDLIFLLGLRNVERVNAIRHWSPWRYRGPENLQVACVTPTDIVIVTAVNVISNISWIEGVSQCTIGVCVCVGGEEGGWWVLRSCNPLSSIESCRSTNLIANSSQALFQPTCTCVHKNSLP